MKLLNFIDTEDILLYMFLFMEPANSSCKYVLSQHVPEACILGKYVILIMLFNIAMIISIAISTDFPQFSLCFPIIIIIMISPPLSMS